MLRIVLLNLLLYNTRMDLRKIIVISYHTCPLSDETEAEIGGINTYVLELSKALARVGYQLDIFTRCVSEKSPMVVRVLENLRVIHLKAGEKIKLPKQQLPEYIPEFTENLLVFINQEKSAYGLVFAHYYMSGLIGLRVKKDKNIPMVMTFHTLGLMKNLVARNEDETADLFRISSEIKLCQAADQIIATSETDMQYIQNLYNCPAEKISVLTPGVDLGFFKPLDKILAKKTIGADINHKLILFVGRIEALKGIDVLLYAIKILSQKKLGFKLCLWIVGGNKIEEREEWSKELQRLAAIRKVLNISSIVKFVGKKNRAELPFYYNSSEIVIMPSQYESFGQTALEAMACGVPVITTDVTGISTILDKKHNSLLTSASNPIMLSQKILKLLEDNSEHEKMSREVYLRVQDLNWDHLAKKFAYFLNK